MKESTFSNSNISKMSIVKLAEEKIHVLDKFITESKTDLIAREKNIREQQEEFKRLEKVLQTSIQERLSLDQDIERLDYIFKTVKANYDAGEEPTKFEIDRCKDINQQEIPTIPFCFFNLKCVGPKDPKPTIYTSEVKSFDSRIGKDQFLQFTFIFENTKYSMSFHGSRPNKKGVWTTYYADYWTEAWPLPVYQEKHLLCKLSEVKHLDGKQLKTFTPLYDRLKTF